jgi:hypothetical protein
MENIVHREKGICWLPWKWIFGLLSIVSVLFLLHYMLKNASMFESNAIGPFEFSGTAIVQLPFSFDYWWSLFH